MSHPVPHVFLAYIHTQQYLDYFDQVYFNEDGTIAGVSVQRSTTAWRKTAEEQPVHM